MIYYFSIFSVMVHRLINICSVQHKPSNYVIDNKFQGQFAFITLRQLKGGMSMRHGN